MTPRSARRLSETQLVALSTQRLLAYRDRLLSLESSSDSSDWEDSELSQLDPALIYFKDDPRWLDAYEALKRVLKQREHFER